MVDHPYRGNFILNLELKVQRQEFDANLIAVLKSQSACDDLLILFDERHRDDVCADDFTLGDRVLLELL
jgi:hypothetical protein